MGRLKNIKTPPPTAKAEPLNIELIPKQMEAYSILSDMSNGVTELLYGGGARGGKAQRLDETVCTPFGFRKVRDLRVGDIITSATTGGQQRIIALHPIETHEYYRVWFNDGTYIDCSEGHLWQVRRTHKHTKKTNAEGNPDDWRVWETRAMYEWMEKRKEGVNADRSLMIPLCAPVQFTTSRVKDRPVDPYLLGVLIGDGCLAPCITDIKAGHISFTTMDKEIEDAFLDAGYKISSSGKPRNRARSYSCHDKGLLASLKKLGITGKHSYNKFIPRAYKLAPIEERKALMRGLMDTDGYVDRRGHMSYTSVSKELSEDVAFIVRSLGGKATITQDKGSYKKDGEVIECRDAYTVYFTTLMDAELVSLPRKKRYCRVPERFCYGKTITEIESIGLQEGRCITVDEPCGLYVTDNFTVTHNSYLGCLWQILNRFQYPGSVGMIGRSDFVALTKTTLVTFFEVLDSLPDYYKDQVRYKAGTQNIAEFANGSKIFFVYFKDKPSDPNFDRFGSYAITDLFVDESQEVNAKAIDVLRGRFSLLTGEHADGTKWQVAPKALYTCNPSRGWNYSLFYKPWKNGNLADFRYFIRSLPADNPYVTQEYIDNLMRSDKVTVQRLVYGNFEYDDDPSALIDYDAIDDLFKNPHIKPVGVHSISADIATKGHDKFILGSWIGNVVTIKKDKNFSPGKQVELDIREVQAEDNVASHYIIVDSDGVGNYLSSYIPGIREFHGGARAGDPKYANLRSECYFKLADHINARRMRVVCTPEQRERLKEELAVIRQAFIDSDTKKKTIISKEEMKKLLGRSPDYADMLMMGMWFRRSNITSGAKLKVHKQGRRRR